MEHDNVSEEIRKNFTEEDLQYRRFFVSNFDTDALSAMIPYIGYDMDIQAAHEEQDYQEMRKAWDRHEGKAGDLWDGNAWPVEEMCVEAGEYEENCVDIIAETMYDEFEEDDIYDEEDLEYGESENDPDEYYDDHYGEYYDGDILENDDLTEEEILEYDRKRDGRRYLCSTAADFMSRKCEEEAIETLIKENTGRKGENDMDDKAILLRNLYNAKNIIEQAEIITQNYESVESRIQNYREPVPVESEGKAIARKVLTGFLICLWGFIVSLKVMITLKKSPVPIRDMRSMINWIIFYLVFILIILIMQWRYLKYCDDTDKNRMMVVLKQNEEIEAYNEKVKEELEVIFRKVKEIYSIVEQELQGWYPEKYIYSDAVIKFIDYIESYRADSMKEAVNLYVEELHKEKELRMQKEYYEKQLQYQKVQTILSVVGTAANLSAAISSHQTAANTSDMAASARQAAESARQGAASARRAADDISHIRSKYF